MNSTLVNWTLVNWTLVNWTLVNWTLVNWTLVNSRDCTTIAAMTCTCTPAWPATPGPL